MNQKSYQKTKPRRHHGRRKKKGGGTRYRCRDGNQWLLRPRTESKTCPPLGTGLNNTGVKSAVYRARQVPKE